MRAALPSLRRAGAAVGLSAVLAACGTAASTRTSASARPAVPLTVSPAVGRPGTVFQLRFIVPAASGVRAGTQRGFELGVRGPQKAGCLGSRTVPVPSAAAGTALDIPLDPARLGGRWCAGSYLARVDEVERPVCAPGMMCPQFVRVVRTVGQVTFRVDATA